MTDCGWLGRHIGVFPDRVRCMGQGRSGRRGQEGSPADAASPQWQRVQG